MRYPLYNIFATLPGGEEQTCSRCKNENPEELSNLFKVALELDPPDISLLVLARCTHSLFFLPR